LAIAIVGALLAALCLARIANRTLPSATLTVDGEENNISLLSVSHGYWHGFDCANELALIKADDVEETVVRTSTSDDECIAGCSKQLESSAGFVYEVEARRLHEVS
jgi:hypothetical protein